MSRVPMGSDGGAWAMDPATALAHRLRAPGHRRPTSSRRSRATTAPRSTGLAAQSHARAAAAWSAGHFNRSVVPVKDRSGLDDPGPGRDYPRQHQCRVPLDPPAPRLPAIGEVGGFDFVALEKYSSVDRINHVHHAGNSSGIVDGAALLLIGNEQVGQEMGLTATRPHRLHRRHRRRADDHAHRAGAPPASRPWPGLGMTANDIDLVEINEAFAAVAPPAFRSRSAAARWNWALT